MNHKLNQVAFIFPGQGESHSVGMGKDFYDNFTVARDTFGEASDILGYDLRKWVFEGPFEKLSETQYCQVAIYVVSMVVLRVVQQEFPDFMPDIVAGLSLGEYSAATAASILTFDQGVQLVQARGALMQQACQEHPSTMAVVLGWSEEKVCDVVQQFGLNNALWIANLNCPGQIVVSGTFRAIEKFALEAKGAGAKRVLPLNVAGAFHSPLMKNAAEELSWMLDKMKIGEPQVPFVMNVTGREESCLETIKKNLILQITHPVRWEASINEIKGKNVDTFFEIGCGKVLTGLNKRMGLLGQTYCVNSVKDLELIKNNRLTTQ